MVTELIRETLTLSDLITRFLDSRHHLSRRTIEYYQMVLRNLEWYARQNQWPEPAAINRSHLRDFLNYVATESYRWPEGGAVLAEEGSTGHRLPLRQGDQNPLQLG